MFYDYNNYHNYNCVTLDLKLKLVLTIINTRIWKTENNNLEIRKNVSGMYDLHKL